MTVFQIEANGLDLAQTAAPVAWGKGKWPSVFWSSGRLDWCMRINGQVCVIRVEQPAPDLLSVTGLPTETASRQWLIDSLGWGAQPPAHQDPVIARLGHQYPGLRPYANGTLAEGIITAIIGQSITVQAAAVTETRVAALFHPGIPDGDRVLYPFPELSKLADAEPALIRTSGVTWRRAEAIVAVARVALEGGLPTDDEARAEPDAAMRRIRELPLVGPWTAASALLWGLGAHDAHPTGDVALLRAAKQSYERPEMTLRDLDKLAEAWRPWRGWAARLLWIELLGQAPRN